MAAPPYPSLNIAIDNVHLTTFRHLDNVNEQMLKDSSSHFSNLYVAQSSRTMDISVVQLNTLEAQMHEQ